MEVVEVLFQSSIMFCLISKFGIIFLNQRRGDQVCDNSVQEIIIFYLKKIKNPDMYMMFMWTYCPFEYFQGLCTFRLFVHKHINSKVNFRVFNFFLLFLTSLKF